MTKLYEISQNNSGGSFQVDENLCWKLYIEAKSANDAASLAEGLGCYWNGCDEGMDCPCCGDRWSEPWESDALDLDKINQWETDIYIWQDKDATKEEIEAKWHKFYGEYDILEEPKWESKYGSERYGSAKVKFKNETQYLQYLANEYGDWTDPSIRVFYLDGTIKEFKHFQ